MSKRGNQGAAKLARAMTGHVSKLAKRPAAIDLGTIQPDMSLVLDSFQRPIPRDGYAVVERLTGVETEPESGGVGDASFAEHTHIETAPIAAGDRVLVLMLDADDDAITPIIVDRVIF